MMLMNVAAELVHCYQQAQKCMLKAGAAKDADDRQQWLDYYTQWMCLAESYEFAQRLNALLRTTHTRRRRMMRDYPLCEACGLTGVPQNKSWFFCPNCHRLWKQEEEKEEV